LLLVSAIFSSVTAADESDIANVNESDESTTTIETETIVTIAETTATEETTLAEETTTTEETEPTEEITTPEETETTEEITTPEETETTEEITTPEETEPTEEITTPEETETTEEITTPEETEPIIPDEPVSTNAEPGEFTNNETLMTSETEKVSVTTDSDAESAAATGDAPESDTGEVTSGESGETIDSGSKAFSSPLEVVSFILGNLVIVSVSITLFTIIRRIVKSIASRK